VEALLRKIQNLHLYVNFSLNSLYKIIILKAYNLNKALWENRMNLLSKSDIKLQSPKIDLIDEIWPREERDEKPNSAIKVHSLNFSGWLIFIINDFS
jgi:hypothetical protein